MRKGVLLFGLLFTLFGCKEEFKPLISGTYKVNSSTQYQYYLSYPKDYQINHNKRFGLLLFLHGGGESGKTLEMVKKHGPPKMMADGYPFPFLVLAPQNPHEKKWWNVHDIIALLDEVVAKNSIDPNRIYLTGLSRGGSAAWDMAVQYPEKFAALAVVCGMAPTPYAHWLDKEMPIRVFHGVEDPVIPVSESDNMVKKLQELGINVQYQRYEGVGHNAWDKAYANDELYQWMNQQKRK